MGGVETQIVVCRVAENPGPASRVRIGSKIKRASVCAIVGHQAGGRMRVASKQRHALVEAVIAPDAGVVHHGLAWKTRAVIQGAGCEAGARSRGVAVRQGISVRELSHVAPKAT